MSRLCVVVYSNAFTSFLTALVVFFFFFLFLDFFFSSCQGKARYVLLGAFNYAGLLLIGAMYLLWKMRNARRQVMTS